MRLEAFSDFDARSQPFFWASCTRATRRVPTRTASVISAPSIAQLELIAHHSAEAHNIFRQVIETGTKPFSSVVIAVGALDAPHLSARHPRHHAWIVPMGDQLVKTDPAIGIDNQRRKD